MRAFRVENTNQSEKSTQHWLPVWGYHAFSHKQKGQLLTFQNETHPATERKNTWDLTQQSPWIYTVDVCATFFSRNTGRHGEKNFILNVGDCYAKFLKRCMNRWFFSLRCRNLHSNFTQRCKTVPDSTMERPHEQRGASETRINYESVHSPSLPHKWTVP